MFMRDKSSDSLFNTIIVPKHWKKYEHVVALLGRTQKMLRKAGKCSSWWHYCWTRKVCISHALKLNSFPFIPVLWGGFLQGGCGQQSGRTAALSEGIDSCKAGSPTFRLFTLECSSCLLWPFHNTGSEVRPAVNLCFLWELYSHRCRSTKTTFLTEA